MGRERLIPVTGATGNVGAEVIAVLRGQDERVVAAARDVARARRRSGEAVEYVPFDFARGGPSWCARRRSPTCGG
jgi:uncharacterized protein YbjT (DUF2867 family)